MPAPGATPDEDAWRDRALVAVLATAAEHLSSEEHDSFIHGIADLLVQILAQTSPGLSRSPIPTLEVPDV
jgi:hypothetical protein